MFLSYEEYVAILESLGYHADYPPQGGYTSSGKFGGPKGFRLEIAPGSPIEREVLQAWLKDLGVDPEAVDRAFDGLDPLY